MRCSIPILVAATIMLTNCWVAQAYQNLPKDESAKKQPSSLKEHLLFYSSFDGTTEAEFAKGDARLYTAEKGKKIADAKPGLHDPVVTLAEGEGMFGDALKFSAKKHRRIFYKAALNTGYTDKEFNGSISFWLKLDPAKDLEPGFCDPIQITDSSFNDGAIWVDFTKENPRDFRLGVIGDRKAWNPEKTSPHDNPEFIKRLIKVDKPTFSREKWSHIVINLKGLRPDSVEAAKGKIQVFFDGESKGELDFNDPFTWDIDKSNILLGLSYIGLMDEFAIFDRPLSPEEVLQVFKAKGGVKSLVDLEVKPAPSEKKTPILDRKSLLERATSQLIKIQESDGAWPYEGVYRVKREIPVGYRIGGTSIVCTSLLYGNESAEATAAIERGVEVILKDLQNGLMKSDITDTYDVRVWGHIYSLDLFCRIRASGRLKDLQTKTDLWIPKLVDSLKIEQIDDGGWNYAGQKRHASFVTAPAVQALLLAKEQGEDVPDEVFEKAIRVLKASRTELGAFQYSGTVGSRKSKLPGSIARSAVCESTLILLGEGNVAHLQDSVNAFHEHWDELEKRRKKTGTHKPPYNVAPYYFYFGHRYLAQSIQLLPKEEQEKQAAKFEAVLMKTKDADDTWNDRVFDRSKAYGTAMSALALLNNVPLPKSLDNKKKN